MPCSKYEGAQRRLCYLTKEWTDWSKVKIKNIDLKVKKTQTGAIKLRGVESSRA